MKEGEAALCDKNANCLFLPEIDDYKCQCKAGYEGTGKTGECRGEWDLIFTLLLRMCILCIIL